MIPHPDYKNIWSLYSKKEWSKIFTTEHLPSLKP